VEGGGEVVRVGRRREGRAADLWGSRLNTRTVSEKCLGLRVVQHRAAQGKGVVVLARALAAGRSWGEKRARGIGRGRVVTG